MPPKLLLTKEQARHVRELWAQGYTMGSIAKAFGVSVMPISDIIRGRRHKDAGGPISPPPPWEKQMARDQWRRPLDPAQIEAIQ